VVRGLDAATSDGRSGSQAPTQTACHGTLFSLTTFLKHYRQVWNHYSNILTFVSGWRWPAALSSPAGGDGPTAGIALRCVHGWAPLRPSCSESGVTAPSVVKCEFYAPTLTRRGRLDMKRTAGCGRRVLRSPRLVSWRAFLNRSLITVDFRCLPNKQLGASEWVSRLSLQMHSRHKPNAVLCQHPVQHPSTSPAVIVDFGIHTTVRCRRPSVSRRRGTNMKQFASRCDVIEFPANLQNQTKINLIYSWRRFHCF